MHHPSPRRGLLVLAGWCALLVALSLACTGSSRTFVVTTTRTGAWTCATPTPRPYGRPAATPTPYTVRLDEPLVALGETIVIDPVAVSAQVDAQEATDTGDMVIIQMDWENHGPDDRSIVPQMVTIDDVTLHGVVQAGPWRTTSAAMQSAGITDVPTTLPPGTSTITIPILIPTDSTVAEISMPLMFDTPDPDNLVMLRWRTDVDMAVVLDDPLCPRTVSAAEEQIVADRLPTLWAIADDLDDMGMHVASDAVRDQVDSLVDAVDAAIDADDTTSLANLQRDAETAIADARTLADRLVALTDALDVLESLADDLDIYAWPYTARLVRDEVAQFRSDLPRTPVADLDAFQTAVGARTMHWATTSVTQARLEYKTRIMRRIFDLDDAIERVRMRGRHITAENLMYAARECRDDLSRFVTGPDLRDLDERVERLIQEANAA